MTSRTSTSFWKCYYGLPTEIQRAADRSFAKWSEDPQHPSLQFKRVSQTGTFYSARVNEAYRSVGQIVDDEIIWFWIGHHKVYDRLLKGL